MSERTWLFTPGHSARMLHNGYRSGCDALVIDWEDAVANDLKETARRTTSAFLTEARSDVCRIGIRINPAGSAHIRRDLEVVAQLTPGFIMLSKVTSPSDVRQVQRIGSPLIALIESARAVEDVAKIATASDALERIGFGALDYCADIRARWTPSGTATMYARAKIVVASRSHDLEAPLDGVNPFLSDLEGLRAEARVARGMGFGGKLLVHPDQIVPTALGFKPEGPEVDHALRVIRAYRHARTQGTAVLRIDGKLIDSATLRWSEQILADAGITPA